MRDDSSTEMSEEDMDTIMGSLVRSFTSASTFVYLIECLRSSSSLCWALISNGCDADESLLAVEMAR